MKRESFHLKFKNKKSFCLDKKFNELKRTLTKIKQNDTRDMLCFEILKRVKV